MHFYFVCVIIKITIKGGDLMSNSFDALTPGIAPGGLRRSSDIKLLICYILSTLNEPIKKEYITTAVVDNGIANYFEIIDAFSELKKNGNIVLEDEAAETYTVSSQGRFISKNIWDELPSTIRERTLSAVSDLMLKKRTEQENTAEVIKLEGGGYIVECRICGEETDLFNFRIFAPDSKQARLIKKNFKDNPEMIYKVMVAAITGNSDFAAQTLEEIKNKGLRKQ